MSSFFDDPQTEQPTVENFWADLPKEPQLTAENFWPGLSEGRGETDVHAGTADQGVSFRAPRTRGAGRSATRGRLVSAALVLGVGCVAVLALAFAFGAIHLPGSSQSSAAQSASAGSLTAANKAHVSGKAKSTKKSRKARTAKANSPASKSVAQTTHVQASKSTVAVAANATTGRVVKMAAAAASVASGKVVVIDAGHQGQGDSGLEPIGPGSSQKKAKVTSGASGQYAPHDESQINLQVALKLRTALQARGIKVIMVRTSQDVDISNSQRAAIANKAHAALFIRLHCDGISDSSKHGFSTLIPAKNQWTGPIMAASAKAGKIVQHAALAATGASDAGIVNRGDLSGFNWSKVPTILVEMGFMSNRAEDRALTTPSYQGKLATGLANGVVTYLSAR